MIATLCDICEARSHVPGGGVGWREVKTLGRVTFGGSATHICKECWDSMVALRTEELAAGGA